MALFFRLGSMQRWVSLCCGCVLLFFSTAAAAYDYFDMPPEELLNAEIVSISKKPQSALQVPAAVYVITRDDILRAGVTTIPDALRLAPGVQVAQVDSNSYAVSIRGFNDPIANKLLVMMDGRTLYNPLFAGTYWETQDTVLEDIDRIEIIRGPGGALWGANAVNGVINIITRTSRETQGNLVSVSAGNYERGTVTARHGGPLQGDGHYRVYAKGFNRDQYPRPAGGENRDAWNGGRAGFRSDWNNDTVTLQGDVYRTNTEQRRLTPIFAPPSNAVVSEDITFEGGNILGRVKKEDSRGGLATFQAYIDWTRRNEPGLLDDQRAIFDFDAQYNLSQRGNHEWIVGGNYRFTIEASKDTPILRISSPHETVHLLSFFVQDRITLTPDTWHLILGTKVEYNQYTGVEHQPNARLEWTPDATQTLWASVSRAVRTPSRIEREVTLITSIAPGSTTSLIPNDNFASEVLIAYEAGYRKQVTPNLTLDAAFFFNDYDKLSTLFLPTAPPGQVLVGFENGATAEAYGAEFATSWRARDNWMLSATYSLMNIEMHAATFSAFNEYYVEKQAPHHQATLRSFWNINDDWSLNTSAYYVSKLSADETDSYVRVDANLGWRINDDTQFNLIGQNLFDKPHSEFGSPTAVNAAQVERSIFGKVTWRF